MSCSPSLTASPADSWPRCWRAKRPRAARGAASWPGLSTPTTPHTSAILEEPREGGLPGVPQGRQVHLDRIGDAGPAVLGRAGRALAAQLDAQRLPAGHAPGLAG